MRNIKKKCEVSIGKYLLIYYQTEMLKNLEALNENVQLCIPFKRLNIVGRIIRNILYRLRCHHKYFYGDWKKNFSNYSVIIIYALRNEEHLISYLCAHKKENQRIIVWYWNPVFRCVSPDKIKNLGCELWSFDPADCKNFDMKFNTTYYFRDLKLPSSQNKLFDVFFCGLNKGRKEKIDEISDEFNKNKLTSLFYIVDDELPVSKRLPYLSYDKYLEKLSCAVAVLDVLQEGQEGMTLRVMESIYFGKKLITTQKSIINEDFYTPDNIFVIGKDNWDELNDFMKRPVKKTPEQILEKYDFATWLSRFDENR